MDYDFEFEKKKVFNMRHFLRTYFIIFLILAISTYLIYAISLRVIFGNTANVQPETVLGVQTEEKGESTINSIIINPNRTKEKDTSRLELSNGIADDYIYLFDNENHTYIEGETVPDHNISFTLGDYKTTKTSNPDGFFSFELPLDTKQFSSGTIELRDDSFQIIKSYNFIFVQRKFMDRTYFVNTKNNSVFSISAPANYKSTMSNFQSIDNTLCRMENEVEKYIADFQNPDPNILLLPNPITVKNISEAKYAVFEIINTTNAIELNACITEIKSNDYKIEWHNESINEVLNNQIKKPDSPVSSPIN
jgi:hypothetical protein